MESYLQPAAVDMPVVEEEAVVVARVPCHPVVTEAIHRVVAVEVAARAQPASVVVVEEEVEKNRWEVAIDSHRLAGNSYIREH